MKEIATNEGITDRILSEIRLAQFVVADFTGQRGGVYFEAGFARGLGREVIWMCREDELKLVHFDVKHLGHVVWATPADLRTKLAESIRANIIPKP
jgi:nucleoside 2-deoxyribosyltransferase